MKYILLLFMLLSGFNLHSQNQGLKSYYKFTHLANICILQGDFDRANLYFDSAFSQYKNVFFIDLNNALYSSIKASKHNDQKILDLLSRIQQKGICVHEHFGKVKEYQPFLNQMNEAKCKQVIDTLLQQKIQFAIDEDQRTRNYAYDKYKNPYHANILQEMNIIDEKCYNDVISYFKLAAKKNIQLEDLVGHRWANISPFTILLHNVPWNRYDIELLEKLALNGIIDARYIAAHIDGFCNTQINDSIQSNTFNETYCSNSHSCKYGSNILLNAQNQSIILLPSNQSLELYNQSLENLYHNNVLEIAKIKVYCRYHYMDGFFYPGMKYIDLNDDMVNSIIENAKSKNLDVLIYKNKNDININ